VVDGETLGVTPKKQTTALNNGELNVRNATLKIVQYLRLQLHLLKLRVAMSESTGLNSQMEAVKSRNMEFKFKTQTEDSESIQMINVEKLMVYQYAQSI
jgi:hypothetical protein